MAFISTQWMICVCTVKLVKPISYVVLRSRDAEFNTDYPPIEYSWFNALTDTPPQLLSASYRYSQETGAIFMIDDSITQLNGIALNPDNSILYIGDIGEFSREADDKGCVLYRQTI
jgi:hypothetical protein